MLCAQVDGEAYFPLREIALETLLTGWKASRKAGAAFDPSAF